MGVAFNPVVKGKTFNKGDPPAVLGEQSSIEISPSTKSPPSPSSRQNTTPLLTISDDELLNPSKNPFIDYLKHNWWIIIIFIVLIIILIVLIKK